MMNPDRRGRFAAAAALAAGVLLFAAALTRALTLEPVAPSAREAVTTPAVEPPPDAPPLPPRVPSETKLAPEDVALAVDNDPFLPDRSRPVPYRLPGEDLPAEPAAPELPPAPEFEVVGTIVDGDSGLAVIRLPDASPRVLGIGETLLGYRLERVGATGATLVGSGRTLELAIAAASPTPSSRETNVRGRGTAQSQALTEVLRSLQQRMGPAFAQQLLRAQQSGANPAELQALLRQYGEQQGGMGRGGAAVRLRRDTMDVPMPAPGNR